MKKFTLLATAIVLMVGCTQKAGTGSGEMDELAKQNIELVKKMIQAYENEDVEALKEIYSVDLESRGPLHDESWPYDSIIKGNAGWFEMADSIKYDVDYIMHEVVEKEEIAGNWVLLWATISWYNIKSEKTYMVDYHSPIRVEDGKIVYEHSYWNQWDYFKQAGAELKWPEKVE